MLEDSCKNCNGYVHGHSAAQDSHLSHDSKSFSPSVISLASNIDKTSDTLHNVCATNDYHRRHTNFIRHWHINQHYRLGHHFDRHPKPASSDKRRSERRFPNRSNRPLATSTRPGRSRSTSRRRRLLCRLPTQRSDGPSNHLDATWYSLDSRRNVRRELHQLSVLCANRVRWIL